MAKERIYPVGVQTFSDIIEEGMIYVDKTALIYNMAKKYKYVFLSRPRRFGKSLLSSTLHSYFEGREELFKGLAIETLEKEWTEYPVLHFDLSTFKNCDLSLFPEKFDMQLRRFEKQFGIEDMRKSAGNRLTQLIEQAESMTGRKVVIIIDEYDAPLLDVLHDETKLEAVRTIMQEFYAPIKPTVRIFILPLSRESQNSLNSASSAPSIILPTSVWIRSFLPSAASPRMNWTPF